MKSKDVELFFHRNTISRKVRAILFAEKQTKKWYDFQYKILNILFDRLLIVETEKDCVYFLKWDTLNYFIK